jgi:RND superfamily putative drug exporter
MTASPATTLDDVHAPAPDPGPRRPALLATVVLLLSALLAGLVLALGPSSAQTSESTGTALPDGAQSAEVAARLAQSDASDAVPALVVFSREDEAPLAATDLAALAERAPLLAELGLPGPPAEPVLSPQGDVATLAVLLSAGLSDVDNAAAVEQLREAATEDLPAGLVAQVTGDRRTERTSVRSSRAPT